MRSLSIVDIWMIISALRWTVLLAITTFTCGSLIGFALMAN